MRTEKPSAPGVTGGTGRVHAGVDGDELTAGDAAGGEEAVAGVRDARMTHPHRGRGTVVVAVAVATKKTRTRVPRRGSAELGGEGDGDHAVHPRARLLGSPRSADASWSLEGVRPSASRAARASRRDHDDMAGAREKGRDVHGVGGGGSSGGERSQGPTVHHEEPRATRGRDARALGVRRRVWRRRIASFADLPSSRAIHQQIFLLPLQYTVLVIQQTVYP